jgi:hypothetical protein
MEENRALVMGHASWGEEVDLTEGRDVKHPT